MKSWSHTYCRLQIWCSIIFTLFFIDFNFHLTLSDVTFLFLILFERRENYGEKEKSEIFQQEHTFFLKKGEREENHTILSGGRQNVERGSETFLEKRRGRGQNLFADTIRKKRRGLQNLFPDTMIKLGYSKAVLVMIKKFLY